jgi:hypothetical protein
MNAERCLENTAVPTRVAATTIQNGQWIPKQSLQYKPKGRKKQGT